MRMHVSKFKAEFNSRNESIHQSIYLSLGTAREQTLIINVLYTFVTKTKELNFYITYR